LILKDFKDGDILVCRITGKIYSSKYDIYLNDWLEYGLKLPSVVRIHKMATLETDMIETLIGQMDDGVLSQIKLIYKTIVE
jgi:mRNA interferase MazF